MRPSRAPRYEGRQFEEKTTTWEVAGGDTGTVSGERVLREAGKKGTWGMGDKQYQQ